MTVYNDSSEMTCQELVELVTDYLEDALPSLARQRFEAHIAECSACQVYLDQVRRTISLLGRPSSAQLAEVERAELLILFRSWKGV